MTAPSPPPPPSTPARRAGRLLAFGAALAALVALGAPLCPVAAVARVPCPGCGLTRATLALFHGHVAEALRLHPLSPIAGPLVVGGLIFASLFFVRHGRWPAQSGPSARWVAALGITLWALLIGVWLLRFHGVFGGPAPV